MVFKCLFYYAVWNIICGILRHNQLHAVYVLWGYCFFFKRGDLTGRFIRSKSSKISRLVINSPSMGASVIAIFVGLCLNSSALITLLSKYWTLREGVSAAHIGAKKRKMFGRFVMTVKCFCIFFEDTAVVCIYKRFQARESGDNNFFNGSAQWRCSRRSVSDTVLVYKTCRVIRKLRSNPVFICGCRNSGAADLRADLPEKTLASVDKVTHARRTFWHAAGRVIVLDLRQPASLRPLPCPAHAKPDWTN